MVLMTSTTKNGHRETTFEDLKGLRAEGYVRDSTLDQRDGFGPELQQKAIENFAGAYGLILGNRWYKDFITGTSTLKRSKFQQALQDAQQDLYDVLLVYHTSRFARNRSDAIRYKQELQGLRKAVVFVSQGIISGNDNDFLNEGINEVLDEHYSRNLSRWVSGGLRMKHEAGMANGKPPLGYRSEKLANGKRESKVPFLEGIGGEPKHGGLEALLAMLGAYSTSNHSYRTLADHLNARGYRNLEGQPFTSGSVEHVLSNRFYDGKAVYHPGRPDEEVQDVEHQVPDEVRGLWLKCQQVKRERANNSAGRPRNARRAYPFSRLTICAGCGRRYGGQPVYQESGKVIRRLYHGEPYCDLVPHSIRVENLMAQFHEGVLPYVSLDAQWQDDVLKTLSHDDADDDLGERRERLVRALSNLRKQHLWGDVSDEDYMRERKSIQQEIDSLKPRREATSLPDMDRAAQLLQDIPQLWAHPGTTDHQREAMVRELLTKAEVQGPDLVAIEPNPVYRPLFAYVAREGVRNGRGDWTRTSDLHVPSDTSSHFARTR